MSSQVGAGHVSIFPVMTGFKAKTAREIKAAGREGGIGFAAELKGKGTSAGRDLGTELKGGFSGASKDIAAATMSTLKRDVASASSSLSKARLKQQDEAGKVRIAEVKLVEALEKYGAGSSQAVAAEERLASARRKHEEANDGVRAASERLKSAQSSLADAEQKVKAATDDSAASAERAVSKWDRLKGAVSDAGNRIKAAGTQISEVGKGLTERVTAPILAGVTALAGAAVAVAKPALAAYGAWEQAVGGIETLFKGSAPVVQKYASQAYKTAGLDANTYMETVTSFSASLISSLGGDTEKAAELANQAVTDMSDNANKMGADMTSVMNTYQSIARGNYAMLDNLKLGYGGTKTEMERLLADAEKLSGQKYDIGNFGDVVSAIHVVQDELGITGTTAKEAASTIEGSVATMKSAWKNWLTEIGKTDGDITGVTKNLVDSVVTAAGNIVPRVQQIFKGLVASIPSLLDGLLQSVPDAMKPLVQNLMSAWDWFSKLDSSVKMAALKFVGFAAALGPVLMVVGKITTVVGGVIGGISNLSGGLSSLGVTFGGAGTGAGGLLQVFTKFAGPIGIVIALIAALWTQSEAFRDGVTQLGTTLLAVGMQVWEAIQPIIETIGGLIGQVMEALMPLVTQVGAVVGELLVQVSPLLTTVGGLVATIIGLLVPVFDWLVSILAPAIENAVQIIGVAINALAPIFSAAIEVVTQIVAAWQALFSGDWAAFWEAIKAATAAVWELLKSIVTGAIQIISSVISGVLSTIKTAWDTTWNAIEGAFSGIWEGIKSGATTGVTAVLSTVIGIKDRLLGFFADAGSWLLDSGRKIIGGLAEGIRSAAQGAIDAVSGVLGQVRDFLPFSPAKKGPFSGRGWTYYSGLSTIQAFADGMRSGQSALDSAASGAMARTSRAMEAAAAIRSDLSIRATAMKVRDSTSFAAPSVPGFPSELRVRSGRVELDGTGAFIDLVLSASGLGDADTASLFGN